METKLEKIISSANERFGPIGDYLRSDIGYFSKATE